MTDRFVPAVPAPWGRPELSPAAFPTVDLRGRAGTPPRPPAWQEKLGHRLLHVLSPRLDRLETPEPPTGLAPYERFEIERPAAPGTLSGLWFPAAGEARGAVLMVHPWLDAGQSFFFQRGRLKMLRRAGFHAATFDLGGIGTSGPAPAAFYDRDLADALAALERRAQGLPLHVWGVSAGGYWAHMVLSRAPGVASAFFECVPLHLIEWSKRMAPWGLPFYLFFQTCLPAAYRFLDLRRHAPCLDVSQVAYVGGGLDRGARPRDTRELARLADGRCLVVRGADHLQAIRFAEGDVIRLALQTFS